MYATATATSAMTEQRHLQARTEDLLRADPMRMACLRAARELALPDWALGAGFVRNLIWDHLHQKTVPTPLNDIDLIYLDQGCLLYTSPSPRDRQKSRMPSSA